MNGALHVVIHWPTSAGKMVWTHTIVCTERREAELHKGCRILSRGKNSKIRQQLLEIQFKCCFQPQCLLWDRPPSQKCSNVRHIAALRHGCHVYSCSQAWWGSPNMQNAGRRVGDTQAAGQNTSSRYEKRKRDAGSWNTSGQYSKLAKGKSRWARYIHAEGLMR